MRTTNFEVGLLNGGYTTNYNNGYRGSLAWAELAPAFNPIGAGDDGGNCGNNNAFRRYPFMPR